MKEISTWFVGLQGNVVICGKELPTRWDLENHILVPSVALRTRSGQEFWMQWRPDSRRASGGLGGWEPLYYYRGLTAVIEEAKRFLDAMTVSMCM